MPCCATSSAPSAAGSATTAVPPGRGSALPSSTACSCAGADADAVGGDGAKVVCLMGPTAVGKTDLAVALVERLPFVIVSVDSAMVYRGMDIGTAKPNAAILARAPHRLIDICDPGDPYSAARFRADALREIEVILARGRVPLLVGGTGLYFR